MLHSTERFPVAKPPFAVFRWLRICTAVGLALAATLLFSEPSRAAVFGSDTRQRLTAKDAALPAKIGTLVSSRNGAFCTAFCVAPDMIATASHCLFGTAVTPAPNLKDLSFRLSNGQTSAATLAAAASPQPQTFRHVVAGTTRLRVAPPIAAAQDWAVARLSSPMCAAGGLPLVDFNDSEIQDAAESGALYQIAVHAELPDTELRRADACAVETAFPKADRRAIERDFAEPQAILFHTCDTGGGSSGSPLLVDTAQGPAVVAINVGTYVLSRSVPTSRTPQAEAPAQVVSEPIANTAISISVVRQAIRELQARDMNLLP